MSIIFAGLFFVLLIAAYCINMFSLPGNWLILGLMCIWFTFIGFETSSSFFIHAGIAAFLGEVLEFVAQYFGAKRYGSSGHGSWGGFIGAILGAIFGAGFLLGFGALLGGLLGAYLGCLAAELLKGRSKAEAKHAAFGNFLGKFFGLSLKLACGIYILHQSAIVLFA